MPVTMMPVGLVVPAEGGVTGDGKGTALKRYASTMVVVMLGVMLGCGDGANRSTAGTTSTRVESAQPQSQPQAQPPSPTSTSDAAADQAEDAVAHLLDPQDERFQQKAPDTFHVKFHTTAGDFVVLVQRNWAPRGADRFYNLVRNGYYDDQRFFRVIEGFMAQFGIHGEPRVSAAWREAHIPDDPVIKSNTRGTVTFATAGPNTRTTQLFINFGNNANLDGRGFAPFGVVVQGMNAVDAIHSGYGEGAPRGRGPRQDFIQMRGNAYLDADFPKLDRIITVRLFDPEAEAKPDAAADDTNE